VPQAEVACVRVGDDGDVMAAQPVRLALRLLAGEPSAWPPAIVFCMTWRFPPPHALVASLESCVRAHAPVGAGLVVRGGDLSCEAETCRARRSFVVRGFL
jgi:hypothetical protein